VSVRLRRAAMGAVLSIVRGASLPTERSDDRECVLVHLDGTSLPDNVYEECDVMTLSDQLGEAIE